MATNPSQAIADENTRPSNADGSTPQPENANNAPENQSGDTAQENLGAQQPENGGQQQDSDPLAGLDGLSEAELDEVIATASGGTAGTEEGSQDDAGGTENGEGEGEAGGQQQPPQPENGGEEGGGGQRPPEPGGDADGEEDERLPKNFRIHVENDPARARFLKILKAEPGVDPVQAWLRVGGKSELLAGKPPEGEGGGEGDASQGSQSQDGKGAAGDPMADIKAEIESLKTQRAAARTAYEYEKADDLSDKIVDAQFRMRQMEAELARKSKDDAAYDTAHAAAAQKAVEVCPESSDPKSPITEELLRERHFLGATEPDFFDDPAFPLKLIDRVKARRPDLFAAKQKPQGQQQQQPQAAQKPGGQTPQQPGQGGANGSRQPAVPQGQQQQPKGSVVPGNAGATQLTRQTALQAIDGLSPDELDALLVEAAAVTGQRR